MSLNLFEIAATAFLVVLTLSLLVFAAKYIRTRAKGRGPFGMFSHPAKRSLSTMMRAKVRGSIPEETAPKPAATIVRSPASQRTPHRPSLHLS